jgi:hypothetical protein
MGFLVFVLVAAVLVGGPLVVDGAAFTSEGGHDEYGAHLAREQ